MAAKKYVYFFGRGRAEGSARMKDLLGGKGANLAEMTNLRIPVSPGFTITTEACVGHTFNVRPWKKENAFPAHTATEKGPLWMHQRLRRTWLGGM